MSASVELEPRVFATLVGSERGRGVYLFQVAEAFVTETAFGEWQPPVEWRIVGADGSGRIVQIEFRQP